MLLLVLAAALGGADRHHAAPTLQATADEPRAGWSQPMQPAGGPQDAPPPDMPQGSGPRATSGGPLFDTVALAQPGDVGAGGIAVAVAGAAPGSFVELTELGGGHTVLALVGSNQAPGAVVLLSEGAFQALGIAPGAGVRVRAALPSPQDQTALRSGAAASARIDAPEVLLKALRKRVPAQTAVQAHPIARLGRSRPTYVAPAAPPRAASRAPHDDDAATPGAHYAAPAPVAHSQPHTPPRAPAVAPRSGYVVQVAALSSGPRASELARTLGGRVVGGGGLYRVQLGPYGDAAAANRARDAAARRGYRDARVARTQ